LITHDLQQGSDAWHQFRLEHFGASEAAAMLGLSKKVTRTELLRMKKTGTAKEFSDWVQKNILDYGHEVEAMARPFIEHMFHIDLYPVTCSDGKLSASCDGLTLLEDIAFEHKQWNETLAANVREDILPDEYMPQCQQIMMVTGAGRVIFTVSDGTEGNMEHMEVFPDQEWFDRIRAGWNQFEKDLAEYVPVAHTEKPVPDAVMQLPALSIQTSGAISIISNLDVFGTKLTEFIEKLDLEPTDDQGFANAENAVKTLQKAQDALEAAEASALAQASSVDEMRRTVALYADTARKTRLMLEKMVKTRKEQIKTEIVSKAKTAFAGHVSALETEIRPIRLVVQQPDLLGAIKNKRTLASLHDSVDTALANAKIAADASAKDVRAKLTWHKENAKGYEFLFADLQQIIQKPADDFQMLVQNRIAQHKLDEQRKLEAERARIQAEEQAKAKLLAEQAKPVTTEEPKSEPIKPVLVKAEVKPSVSPVLMGLARRDLSFIRGKYESIPELSGVMREIDLFLAADAPEARRA
jgi:predicted phage-related endonuclease